MALKQIAAGFKISPRLPSLGWLHLLFFGFLLLFGGPAFAQDDASRLKGPIFWADGIVRQDQLERYQAAGLNTVVVRLTWTPTEEGAITLDDVAPQQEFARAAAARGLKIIFALPAAPTGLENNFRISAESDSYLALWTAWIQASMSVLKNTPNLIGWMLPDDPRGLRIYDDLSFQNWLQKRYANMLAVNRQWKSNFNDFDDVTIDGVSAIAVQWRGMGVPPQEMGMAEVYNRLLAERKKPDPNGWAFHPASLALAHYKWDTYRTLLSSWVEVIKVTDPQRSIFAGRTPDYAQLLSIPAGIDYSMPEMFPGQVENDIITHNPQSIDIARRGGRFGAIPILTSTGGPAVPGTALADLLPRWVQEACGRGASGVGFASWQGILEDFNLRRAVGNTLQRLSQAPYKDLWGRSPINTAAILLTPLSDGATVQYGQPPLRFSRGVYGFGEDIVSGEPSDLVWAMRWGTAYGGFDYISPDDLGTAPLDRYTTILLPQALSVSTEMSQRLASYVANGGVIVADLGIGAAQNGNQVNSFSPILATLFGVAPPFEVNNLAFNVNGMEPHPLFPTWSRAYAARPGLVMTTGDGPDSSAFAGPVGYSLGIPSALSLAAGPQLTSRFTTTGLVQRCPITVNTIGQGCAVFAPFRLWSYWRPGHYGFDTFHGDLFGRGALAAIADVASLVPLPKPTHDGSVVFPELLNHSTGVVLANHAAPGLPNKRAVVHTSGVGDWLWRGAVVYLPNSNQTTLTGGRPAPTEVTNELEGRSRSVALYVDLKPGEFDMMSMRPIALQNLSGGPIVGKIAEESPQKLAINVWPNSSGVLSNEDEWQPVVKEPTPTRITIVSAADGYNFTPGSQHRVSITDYAKGQDKKGRFATVEKLVQANAESRLVFEFSGSACAVEVTPMSAANANLRIEKRW